MGIAGAWPAPAAGEEPAVTAQSACHSGPLRGQSPARPCWRGAVPGSQARRRSGGHTPPAAPR